MAGAEGFFTDRERPLEQRLRIRKTLLPLVQRGQVVQRGRDLDRIEAGCFSETTIARLSSGSASASRPWLP
jgi:hypothetical protein